jgi:CubicO group peptidase (beta-lactamase class C family)
MNAIVGAAPTPQLQRQLVASRYLSRAPRRQPGTEFEYCNTGYIIAGLIAERLGGAAYEDLLHRHVMAPLGIADYGVGAPGRGGADEQPLGHSADAARSPIPPDSSDADNPAFVIPAGGVNITMAGWARYAEEHVAGEHGRGVLLNAAACRELHMPGLEGGNYAFGWGVLVRDGAPALITHNGSNGAWFADIRAYPPTGYIYLMATNDGREEAGKQAFRRVRSLLDARYSPLGD